MSLFTNQQLKRFSNIFDNAGQVLLGSLVLTPIISPVDLQTASKDMAVGTIITLFVWWMSLRLERISSII